MNSSIKYVLPVVILVAAGIGGWAIYASREEPEMRHPEVLPPLVRVLEIRHQDIALRVRSQGTVLPRTESQLVPEVSGRVLRVSPSFVSGGFFEAGETLMEIDPYDYQQALIQARSRVAQARLRLAREEAEAEVARREWEELGEGDGSDLTLRVPQVADARAALLGAEAGMDQANRDVDRTRVRAPYAGRVRQKIVDVGQYVTRGAPVGRIYAIDFAEVRLPLPDAELAFLDGLPLVYRGDDESRGPEVVLRAEFAGALHEWSGRIVRTEGEIDVASRMVHVVAQVADPYGRGGEDGRPPLAVGMFVEAEILGRTARRVSVLPRSALHGEDQVWVVDADDRLWFREVEILRAETGRILVRAGLEPGERVCLSSMEAVTDGMRVRARIVQEPAS